jgi:hypothetical protein
MDRISLHWISPFLLFYLLLSEAITNSRQTFQNAKIMLLKSYYVFHERVDTFEPDELKMQPNIQIL